MYDFSAFPSEKFFEPPQGDRLQRTHVALADDQCAARCDDARQFRNGGAYVRHVHQNSPANGSADTVGLQRKRSQVHPLGAALTLDELDRDPYAALARLRDLEPVSWVPVLGGWLVTRRDLAIAVMRDAERFTVDDPRFSTAQVVGPSMLSLDGPEHKRHRDPFAEAFLKPDASGPLRRPDPGRGAPPGRRSRAAGAAEVRRDLAGPLAVGGR